MNASHPVSEYLTVAVRGWTGKRRESAGKSRPRSARPRSFAVRRMLVIDTETLTDTTQALTFGSAKLVGIQWNRRQGNRRLVYASHEVEREVLFHNDSLARTDPTGYDVLVKYAESGGVPLVPRAEFVETWIRYYCERRSTPNGKSAGAATMVYFNAPFDISRLAEHVGVGRGRHAGAFSFRIFPEHDGAENRYRRRIIVRHLDSKKALKSWGTSLDGSSPTDSRDRSADRGQFLDLRQLIWGMTNDATSLARACELFGLPDEYRKTSPAGHGQITPEYIDYNRQDVTATVELAVAVLREYVLHPIDTQPSKVYSPASLAKGYLRRMGVTSMFDRPGFLCDMGTFGHSISTFYGGRAECRIRRTPVPIQVCDFTSMYPTVNALMGLWGYLTAESLTAEDATEDVRNMLASVTVDRLLNPELWRSFVGMVQIVPDGDVLPVRAAYSGTAGDFNVGLNRFVSREPLWYTIPDAVASTLLTGRPPTVVRAVRFVPAGKLSTLQPVDLLGTVPIDPGSQDFFREVVERRQTIKRERGKGHVETCACERCRAERFLKVLANAGSYGVFVQMTRTDAFEPRDATVYGAFDEPWSATVTADEEAEEFCYPPIGASITGAARLMLAIVEKLVTDRGGSWLFCDTDSMSIVADETGSLVPCDGGQYVTADGRPAVQALTYQDVAEIREQVNRLNPYDRNKIPDILKVEATCWGYMVSAKRYTLFRYNADGRPVVPHDIDGKGSYSSHGLGMYFNPINPLDFQPSDETGDESSTPVFSKTEWIRQVWQHILDEHHGLNPRMPEWSRIPAISRGATVSSPHILRCFRHLNEGRTYDAQIKPFNFLLCATEETFGKVGPGGRRLISPFNTDPSSWNSPETLWYDLHDPNADPIPGDRVSFRTMHTVLRGYRRLPENKSLDPNGEPGRSNGLLRRRTVRVKTLIHIGKESNALEDRRYLRHADASDYLTVYETPNQDVVSAIISMWSLRAFASMVNAHSNAVRFEVARIQAADQREARQTRKHVDTWTDTVSVIAAEIYARSGAPVTVTHETISRFLAGSRVNPDVRDTITLTAAKSVARCIGLTSENVSLQAFTHTDVLADLVFAVWNDAGRPNPNPERMCVCGCCSPAVGRSSYASTSCRQRSNRNRRNTVKVG